MVLLLVFVLPLGSPDRVSLPDFSFDLGDGDGGQFLFSISNSSKQPKLYSLAKTQYSIEA
jgi:hypothetical protein